jgi:hypothetical protein
MKHSMLRFKNVLRMLALCEHFSKDQIRLAAAVATFGQQMVPDDDAPSRQPGLKRLQIETQTKVIKKIILNLEAMNIPRDIIARAVERKPGYVSHVVCADRFDATVTDQYRAMKQ